jgi:hypothetical protein
MPPNVRVPSRGSRPAPSKEKNSGGTLCVPSVAFGPPLIE